MDSLIQSLTSPSGQGVAYGVEAILKPWTAPSESVHSIQQPLPSALFQHSVEQTQAVVVAQYFDQDLFGDIGKAWNHFVKTGQIWALVIGLVVGYVFRGMTTY